MVSIAAQSIKIAAAEVSTYIMNIAMLLVKTVNFGVQDIGTHTIVIQMKIQGVQAAMRI